MISECRILIIMPLLYVTTCVRINEFENAIEGQLISILDKLSISVVYEVRFRLLITFF